MQAELIKIPSFSDRRGNLAFIENLPFAIKRVFYTWDICLGATRGGHALKTCEQFLVPLSGALDVTVISELGKKTYSLGTPVYGLYLPPLAWRTLHSFASGTVCLVLASELYDANDYYRNFADFLEALSANSIS